MSLKHKLILIGAGAVVFQTYQTFKQLTQAQAELDWVRDDLSTQIRDRHEIFWKTSDLCVENPKLAKLVTAVEEANQQAMEAQREGLPRDFTTEEALSRTMWNLLEASGGTLGLAIHQQAIKRSDAEIEALVVNYNQCVTRYNRLIGSPWAALLARVTNTAATAKQPCEVWVAVY
jgi:hypothetical protein